MPANENAAPTEHQPTKISIACPNCRHRHSVSLSKIMRKIGRIKSDRKSVSSRVNGQLGGRPINVNSKRQKRLMSKVGGEPSSN